MSEDNNSSGEQTVSKPSIEQFTSSPAEQMRQQAERSKKQQERSKDVLDSIWNEAKAPEKGNTSELVTDEAFTAEADTDPSEDTTRTSSDIIDEVWNEYKEEDGEDSTEDSEEGEFEENDAEEVNLEDMLVASIEGEDGVETINIPKNAKIKVKVDGQEQEITLQEFANGISGERAIAQKFSALNGEQKAYEARLNEWNASSAKSMELLNEGKIVEGIEHVAERMGQDPQLLFTSLFEEITPILNDYANLSENDRNAWVQDLKNKKAEFQARSAQKELNELRAKQEQQGKVQEVRETYGLNEAAFTQAYHALEAEMDAGTLEKRPITPELVGEYTRLVTYEGYAVEALKGTEHEGDASAVNQVLQAVNQMAHQGQEISAQAVKDLVFQALGRQQQIEKSKKVKKSMEKKGVAQKTKGGKTPRQVKRANPQDRPKNWMERAMEDLDSGISAEELGLVTRRK